MKFSRKIVLGLAALAIAGVALAQAYYGYNPVTNLTYFQGPHGEPASTAPVVTATSQTISAQNGTANVGQFVATGATTGAFTFTFASAAPNGWFCIAFDNTTSTDFVKWASATPTTAVFTGTIVSGDKISYVCEAY